MSGFCLILLIKFLITCNTIWVDWVWYLDLFIEYFFNHIVTGYMNYYCICLNILLLKLPVNLN